MLRAGNGSHPSDLIGADWVCSPASTASLAARSVGGHSYRVILDAICYLLRSGCAWRLRPNGLRLWPTV